MADPKDAFPTFSELCQRAREVEKKPFIPPAGQIDGTIHVRQESEIFPREIEDYTYAYLLSEAQKIERNLSITGVSLPAGDLRHGF